MVHPGTEAVCEEEYDPRKRPWYNLNAVTNDVIFSQIKNEKNVHRS